MLHLNTFVVHNWKSAHLSSFVCHFASLPLLKSHVQLFVWDVQESQHLNEHISPTIHAKVLNLYLGVVVDSGDLVIEESAFEVHIALHVVEDLGKHHDLLVVSLQQRFLLKEAPIRQESDAFTQLKQHKVDVSDVVGNQELCSHHFKVLDDGLNVLQ